jgi:hypothetical protein
MLRIHIPNTDLDTGQPKQCGSGPTTLFGHGQDISRYFKFIFTFELQVGRE